MTDQNASDPVILFPGQGSQENNMGRALAERSTQAMERWEKAERLSKLPLREIYWEADNDDMADTKALQPAMFVTAFNLWEHLANTYLPPFTAGHSLGEFTALAAARVLDPDEILEMVILRGQLMAGVDPSGAGAMAAVLKLDHDQVETVVNQARESDRELRIANYNAPNQYVISGLAHGRGKGRSPGKGTKRAGRAPGGKRRLPQPAYEGRGPGTGGIHGPAQLARPENPHPLQRHLQNRRQPRNHPHDYAKPNGLLRALDVDHRPPMASGGALLAGVGAKRRAHPPAQTHPRPQRGGVGGQMPHLPRYGCLISDSVTRCNPIYKNQSY